MELSLAERRLLRALPGDGSPVTIDEAARAAGFKEAVEALRAAGGPERAGLVEVEATTRQAYALSPEGLRYQKEGLPERRALKAIRAAGGSLPLGRLSGALPGPEVGVAVGWLRKKGWAQASKDADGATILHAKADAPLGADEATLGRLGPTPLAMEADAGVELLRQRGGVLVESERTQRRLRLTAKGREAAGSIVDADGEEWNDVTPERLARWAAMTVEQRAKVRLRPFELGVDVAPRRAAKPHPLTQMIEEIRRIFHGMGFQEIAGDYVESAYWNLDALFIPQDHPAREMQDTFYLQEPGAFQIPKEELERARDVHEKGGATGSTGWGGRWDPAVAQKALLRTHTTNTTVRYLATAFARDEPVAAHKVFGIGKVFRKETMDATHLPEFYQIEGIVTEPGASFDMLVGLCREFFSRMGFPQIRLRPAYFPYTEPSMEIEVHYNGRSMELGGSGIFRPEVTQPLGVPNPVLAWGFGLERLATMRLGLKDIRELYVSDVEWLKDAPLQ